MHSLYDYVTMVANSMGIKLDEEKLNRITNGLIHNDNYNAMLEELERMIRIGEERH